MPPLRGPGTSPSLNGILHTAGARTSHIDSVFTHLPGLWANSLSKHGSHLLPAGGVRHPAPKPGDQDSGGRGGLAGMILWLSRGTGKEWSVLETLWGAGGLRFIRERLQARTQGREEGAQAQPP